MKILIKGGRVVDPKNDFDKVADVLVDNGVISEIGENINADGDVTVIDAEADALQVRPVLQVLISRCQLRRICNILLYLGTSLFSVFQVVF